MPMPHHHHLHLHLHLLVLALALFLLPTNLSAQAYTNISLNTTFSPLTRPTWPSPSGDFAFGFRAVGSDPALYLLAIWFNKLPNKTVVWTANGAIPVSSKYTAKLAGQLSLMDPTGQQIWSSGTNSSSVSYAAILDTGNLVLAASDSSIIWQSFDNPTDTILPGQIVDQGTHFYSSLLDNDYARGRFQLSLATDGNLVMYPVGYPTAFFIWTAYWAARTSGSGIQLVCNTSGALFLSYLNGTQVPVMSAPAVRASQYYLRITLDPDGILRQYTLPKNKVTTQSWTVTNNLPDDSCSLNYGGVSGPCGVNSYCESGDNARSICHCLPHYSFIDPTRTVKGCSPDFIAQSCELGAEASFEFTQMYNAQWLVTNADEQSSPMNQTECIDSCLKDCFCSAAIYTDQSCGKKRFPLLNGQEGSNPNISVFIKYSTINKSAPSFLSHISGDEKRGWVSWRICVLLGSLLFGGSVALNLVLVGFNKRRRDKKPSILQRNLSIFTGSILWSFTYTELEAATKGFSEVLGRGAFGMVYKGVLSSSQERTIPIAVKKLQSLSEAAERDFENEVVAIGQTHHKNLVRLLGFCKEGAHCLMVFEFMSNGSLNKCVFKRDRPEWNQRVKIALGIAEGLAYLHEECRTQIIHCDIKPQNILLDDNYEARISDFGLAKLLRLEQTRTSTGIRGTIGYFAPEWFKNVAITSKVDVYSFGVMLLEIICCRKNLEWGTEENIENTTVVEWAKECLRNRRLDLLVGEDDDEMKRDVIRLERFVMVGISCIQDEPWLRPSMKKVVQMLEGTIAVSLPPKAYSN